MPPEYKLCKYAGIRLNFAVRAPGGPGSSQSFRFLPGRSAVMAASFRGWPSCSTTFRYSSGRRRDGDLPPAAGQRLATASETELDRLIERVLSATTLDEVFAW